MRILRSWRREPPLPRGERVGVRGFGRLSSFLNLPNPLILSFSPISAFTRVFDALWGRRDAASRSRCPPLFQAHANERRGRAKRPSMSMIRKSGHRFSERSCSTKILERQQCWRSRWVSPPALTGDEQRRRCRPYSSLTRRRTSHLRIAERQRHETRGLALLHAHQHLMLALRLGVDQSLAHLADIGDRFTADIEDDGAGLKTLLGGGAVRIDRC